MDRLDAFRAFALSWQHGSFAAAAREMDVTRSQVSKLVASLEETYNVKLLNRTSRALSLTSAGAELHEYVRSILALSDEVSLALTERRTQAIGKLVVNAPMSFGTIMLAPRMSQFLKQHPRVELRMDLNDRMLNPIEMGFDLSLRIAHVSDSNLAARRICAVKRSLYASPAYLEQHGIPVEPAQLAQHRCLNYGHNLTGAEWLLSDGRSEKRVRVGGALCSNNGEMLAQAAADGLGIVLQPDFITQQWVARGELVQILGEWQEAPLISLYALYVPSSRLPMAARAFIDFLVREFNEEALAPFA
ncbi:LysR family transcriptional regulator [Undibacterium pigrum]|uniref:LysR family transcriptional regulator n=1 Tax=Undibacterium pigrum TaxID=401470 RepID=A0A318J5J9_9BURK|nr:LysR family transcriptional regulator [Undibacterium pigrum]PXX41911.1 LysR family transcriptional regulator [Undibacterium pigrum]